MTTSFTLPNLRIPYIIALTTLLVTACRKDEPEPPATGNGGTPPAWVVPGCYVQYVHDAVQNPLYTFDFLATQPDRLIGYATYWALSGDLRDEYELIYDEDTYPVQLVRIDHHVGGIDALNPNPEQYRVLHWRNFGDDLLLDSIVHFGWDGSVHLRAGVTLFTLNSNALVEEEYYVDDPTTDITSFNDEYSVIYEYNADGQMLGQFRYDANEVLYFTETYVLSPYLQPNHLLNVNPAIIDANRYAPESITTWYTGTSTQTYHFLYQVNAHNYIIEQDWVIGGDTSVYRWFGYECFF